MNWYTDIKLDENWKLTQATNGDAPLVSDVDAFLQDIRLESITQEGELFYDQDYGWSLLDFLHSLDDETTKLEIEERVKSKLAARDLIDAESIAVVSEFKEDVLTVQAYFRLAGVAELQRVEASLSRVQVEVIESD